MHVLQTCNSLEYLFERSDLMAAFDAEYRLLGSELFIDRKRVVVWT